MYTDLRQESANVLEKVILYKAIPIIPIYYILLKQEE